MSKVDAPPQEWGGSTPTEQSRRWLLGRRAWCHGIRYWRSAFRRGRSGDGSRPAGGTCSTEASTPSGTRRSPGKGTRSPRCPCPSPRRGPGPPAHDADRPPSRDAQPPQSPRRPSAHPHAGHDRAHPREARARAAGTLEARRPPPPARNARVGPYEADAAWPAERVIVEVDGWAAHGHRGAFERDRARDADLQARLRRAALHVATGRRRATARDARIAQVLAQRTMSNREPPGSPPRR